MHIVIAKVYNLVKNKLEGHQLVGQEQEFGFGVYSFFFKFIIDSDFGSTKNECNRYRIEEILAKQKIYLIDRKNIFQIPHIMSSRGKQVLGQIFFF